MKIIYDNYLWFMISLSLHQGYSPRNTSFDLKSLRLFQTPKSLLFIAPIICPFAWLGICTTWAGGIQFCTRFLDIGIWVLGSHQSHGTERCYLEKPWKRWSVRAVHRTLVSRFSHNSLADLGTSSETPQWGLSIPTVLDLGTYETTEALAVTLKGTLAESFALRA